MYQVELKSAGSWDQFHKPICTLNASTITRSPNPTTTFSSWRHHHQPVEFFFKNRRWTGFLRPQRLAPLILQGLEAFCCFACHSLSVSFIFSSHIDVQVFASSTTWTRDCRSSSDLTTVGMLLSASNATISLLQTSFGCFKQWVECFAFVGLGEDDLCDEQQQKKSRILNFGPWVVGRTYSPMLSW